MALGVSLCRQALMLCWTLNQGVRHIDRQLTRRLGPETAFVAFGGKDATTAGPLKPMPKRHADRKPSITTSTVFARIRHDGTASRQQDSPPLLHARAIYCFLWRKLLAWAPWYRWSYFRDSLQSFQEGNIIAIRSIRFRESSWSRVA